MTDARQALADRVRAALPHGRPVREVSMFGGLSFMLDDRMVVSVNRRGSLLVRIDPGRSAELLSIPGAEPAVMGADRPMGPGWLTVTAHGLTTDQQLADWVGVALQHHSRQATEPSR
jgi:hypothetical protein